MSNALNDLESIPEPNSFGPLSPREILMGQRLDPKQVIAVYNDDQYEEFVKEWARDALGTKYALVRRASGAGDMGRDVLGFETKDIQASEYDNYQCKHYGNPLAPGDAWIEIGKLCWYTYQREYRLPRCYYFVAPCGIGPKMQRYLEDPESLKRDFIAEWDKQCASNLQRGVTIPLEGEFSAYIDRLDFRIFSAVDPDELIAQHAKTRWHAARFGGGLQRRPRPSAPPSAVQPGEVRYVRQLLDAYGSHLGNRLSQIDDLGTHEPLGRHFARQRENFYRAESLRQFERDSLPSDAGFQALMSDIYAGVIDVCEAPYADGYECVRETVQAAMNLPITSYALADHLEMADKAGICHHLANDERLRWCKDCDVGPVSDD